MNTQQTAAEPDLYISPSTAERVKSMSRQGYGSFGYLRSSQEGAAVPVFIGRQPPSEPHSDACGSREGWKLGDEFAPYHTDASQVEPGYRDGWNACFRAAMVHFMGGVQGLRNQLLDAAVVAGEQLEAMVDRNSALLAASPPVPEREQAEPSQFNQFPAFGDGVIQVKGYDAHLQPEQPEQSEPVAQREAVPDTEIARLINELRALFVSNADTRHLREHVVNVILPALGHVKQSESVPAGASGLAQRLRDACANVRTKSYPLADLIPLMQQAADALAASAPAPEATGEVKP